MMIRIVNKYAASRDPLGGNEGHQMISHALIKREIFITGGVVASVRFYPRNHSTF
jgi:hypothetical protein